MRTNEISLAIDRAIEGRRLLEHPFYRRWERGELSAEELQHYAEQYRHIERAIPAALDSAMNLLPDGEHRCLVSENLHDELTNPVPHVVLFEGFAKAVGATTSVEPTPATREVVARYEQTSTRDAVSALATLAAYEVQGAAIAESKGDGLRRHYGLSDEGTEFWDVHASLEKDHANWSVDALCALGADSTVVFEAARSSADAWWSFLDERELVASSAASA